MPHIVGLRQYPLKSAQALPNTTIIRLGLSGPTLDRRWMIAARESNGSWRFVSQRDTYGRVLARVRTELLHEPHQIALFPPDFGKDVCLVPADPHGGSTLILVTLHDRPVTVLEMGARYDRWVTNLIGRDAKLVRAPVSRTRAVPKVTVHGDAYVGLADADQLLIVSDATLTEVGRRSGLDRTEVVNRLRPNVIVGTDPDEKPFDPFEEDTWADCRSNGVALEGTAPCSRCSIISVNQETAEIEPPDSPANLLTLLRGSDRWKEGPFVHPDLPRKHKVYLGMNFIYHGIGDLILGASWEILSRRNPWERAA